MMKSTLAAWFETPLGQHVLDKERSFCDDTVADIFGFNALQIGLPMIDLLRASRMPLRFAVDTDTSLDQEPPTRLREENIANRGGDTSYDSNVARLRESGEASLGDAGIARLRAGDTSIARLRARGSALPVASQSMDLVLLPHVLEFSSEPHHILREVDRIMMPEGRVIVIGFNPWSLWGARQVFSGRSPAYPWCGDFISLVRLKDWLSLLGFDVLAGRLACYVPPLTREQWLRRFQFMESAGDRWWSIAGGVYMLQAIKRVQGMRLITPKWKERRVADRVVAPLSRKQGGAQPPRNASSNVIALPRRRQQ